MKLRVTESLAVALGWAALLAPSVVLRLYPAVPLAADEKVFAVVARQIAGGAVLYRDVFDHKGPALYWAINVWSAIADGSFLGVRVGSTVASVAVQLAVYVVVRRLTERRSAALFASMAIGLGAWITNRIFGVELWMASATAIALALVICWRTSLAAFLAGTASGFALMVRPTGALDALLLGLVVARFTGGNGTARTLCYVVGLVVSSGAFLAPLVNAGAGADAAYALLTFNSYYSSVIPLDSTLVLTIARWLGVQLLLCSFLWLPAVGATLRPPEDAERRRWAKLFVLWTVAALMASLLGRRPFNHYLLQPYLPMSLLAGIWFADLRIRLPALTPRAVIFTSCTWLVMTAGLAWAHLTYLRAPQVAYALTERRVASAVDALTVPGDRVYVWGNATNVYYFSKRAPATRYLYYPPFRGAVPPPPFEQAYWRDWLSRFDSARPAVVVDCSATRWNDLPWLDPECNEPFAERLRRQYEPVQTVSGFRIYARRDRRNAELR